MCLFHLSLVSQPEFSQDKRTTVSLTGIRASENIGGAERERSTRLQAEGGRNSHRRRQPEAVRQVGKPGLTGESEEPPCLGTNVGAHGDIYEAASLTFCLKLESSSRSWRLLPYLQAPNPMGVPLMAILMWSCLGKVILIHNS